MESEVINVTEGRIVYRAGYSDYKKAKESDLDYGSKEESFLQEFGDLRSFFQKIGCRIRCEDQVYNTMAKELFREDRNAIFSKRTIELYLLNGGVFGKTSVQIYIDYTNGTQFSGELDLFSLDEGALERVVKEVHDAIGLKVEIKKPMEASNLNASLHPETINIY